MTELLQPLTPSRLSEPLVLAGKRLRNRVAHASMTTHMGYQSRVTDRQIRYYANRAQGGAALIVTEPLLMAPHQTNPARIRVWNDDNLGGLTRWAEAVEREDCRLLGQIQDPGRGHHDAGRNYSALAPSALPDDLSWTMPHALTTSEIRLMIADFAASSSRLKKCGFSGVELSGAHGHLFSQFMSPWANRRKDEYGGNGENRARFMQELIQSIRDMCGSDFIIGLKLPGDDGIPGGIGPDESAILTSLLTSSKEVDYVCFAQGAHARSLETHVPDRYGSNVPYASLIRRLRDSANGVPVMALGRITDPAEAEAFLTRGDAELIGMGRTLLADPAWYKKAMQGRTNDIRYCISCNNCWDTIITHGEPLACVNNPRVADEKEVDWWPKPEGRRHKVVVVGAGIAGMEAAWVAAARGHDVKVYGSGSSIGGKARLRSRLPGGETITSIYDYQQVCAEKSGVRIELGAKATLSKILADEPDTVILATGGTMHRPEWIPEQYIDAGLINDLQTSMEDIVRISARQPGTAVVYDMDHSESTYAAVELLANRFEKVILLTPRALVAQEESLVTRQGIVRRLSLLRVEIVLLSEPILTDRFEEGVLEYEHVYTKDRSEIDNVVFLSYSTPRAPNVDLVEPLKERGLELYLVGDCRVNRGLMGATADGHKAGLSVGKFTQSNRERKMTSNVSRNIDSDTAMLAIKAAREKATELKLDMSIAVCDAAGHLKAFLRMDGASLISLQIAQDKAHTAISGGIPTHKWHEYIKDDAPLIHGIVHTPRFIIFGGGYPIIENGQIVGGIGISGGHYSQDMECAKAALKAIGAPE